MYVSSGPFLLKVKLGWVGLPVLVDVGNLRSLCLGFQNGCILLKGLFNIWRYIAMSYLGLEGGKKTHVSK